MWSDRDKLNEWIQVGIWYDVSEATVNAFVPIWLVAMLVVVVHVRMGRFTRMLLCDVIVLVILHEERVSYDAVITYTDCSYGGQMCVCALTVYMANNCCYWKGLPTFVWKREPNNDSSDHCRQATIRISPYVVLFPFFNCPKAGNTATNHCYSNSFSQNHFILISFFSFSKKYLHFSVELTVLEQNREKKIYELLYVESWREQWIIVIIILFIYLVFQANNLLLGNGGLKFDNFFFAWILFSHEIIGLSLGLSCTEQKWCHLDDLIRQLIALIDYSENKYK